MENKEETLEQKLLKQKPKECKTLEELKEYIQSLIDLKHDYSSCPQAMVLASTAVFNFIGKELQVTNFQASYAALHILQRTQNIEGPFIVLRAEDLVYPQYDLYRKLNEFIEKNRDWVIEQAKDKLKTSKEENVAEKVWEHWESLAKG